MMLRAAKIATGKPPAGSALEAAMEKAAQDGVVAPNEIHQLYAESIRSFGSNIWIRRAMRVWGSLFAVSEAFNRRLTFAAAYETAQAAGREDPYGFAVRAVEETQGIYNRGNRPNWARGAVGATVFTFKQFSIAYLEFLSRLPRRQQALALGLLVLAAGIQGMPFADDLDDFIDTLGQSLGYNTNVKHWKRKVLEDTMGATAGAFVMQGLSSLPGFPLDVQARRGNGPAGRLPRHPWAARDRRGRVRRLREVDRLPAARRGAGEPPRAGGSPEYRHDEERRERDRRRLGTGHLREGPRSRGQSSSGIARVEPAQPGEPDPHRAIADQPARAGNAQNAGAAPHQVGAARDPGACGGRPEAVKR
jgi:hypothetical protein